MDYNSLGDTWAVIGPEIPEGVKTSIKLQIDGKGDGFAISIGIAKSSKTEVGSLGSENGEWALTCEKGKISHKVFLTQYNWEYGPSLKN